MKSIKNLFAHPCFRIFQNPTFLFVAWMCTALVYLSLRKGDTTTI